MIYPADRAPEPSAGCRNRRRKTGQRSDDNWEEQAANRLTDAMQGLDERSQDIIRARWLDEDNKSTLQELADRYGVSAERVRQLEKNAMKKLRAAIEA